MLMQVQKLRDFRLLSAIDSRVGSLDEVYFKARLRVKAGRKPLFHMGWGDNSVIDAVDQRWDAPGVAPMPTITWNADWKTSGPAYVRSGSFESTVYVDQLPDESKRVGILLVRPERERARYGVVLAPTSRELDFKRRMRTAMELARNGIWSLLLDNPLMGSRKPEGQFSTVVSKFSDYPLLTAACVEEVRMALEWMRGQGFTRLCAAGVSQGGYTSAAAGMRLQFSISVVAVATPHSGGPVVLDGIPGRMVDWAILDKTCPAGATAREHMEAVFERTRLDRLPDPVARPSITLFAAKRDRYVPEYSYQLLQDHWADMAKVVWTDGGHVSTILERTRYAKEIEESLLCGVDLS